MKFVRFILISLGVLIALAAIMVAALFTSPLQTWIAQLMLDRQAGWHSSVGEVSVGLNSLKVTDLRLQANGAVLNLPSLEARLPVKSAAWDHSVRVRSVVAKGWTLDLSNLSPASALADTNGASASRAPTASSDAGSDTPAQTMDAAAKKAQQIFRKILGGWHSPYDLSLDGVELEGDVILSISAEKPLVKIHVLLKGGGLSAGHQGAFAIEADTTEPWPEINSVLVHGQFLADMDSPRSLNRVEMKGEVSVDGAGLPKDFGPSIVLAANRNGTETAITLEVMRERRNLASIKGQISATDSRVSGTWRLDLHDTDVAPFLPQRALPNVNVDGEGSFNSDAALAEVHLAGVVEAGIHHLEAMVPAMAQVDGVLVAAKFELSSRRRILRIDALDMFLAATRSIAAVHALQAVDFERDTGRLQLADATRDGLKVSVEGLPMDWISAFTDKFEITGGDATGEFVVRQEKNGWSLQPTTPLTATGVALARAGRPLAQDLDLSVSLSAEIEADGWQVKAAPFTVSNSNHRIASVAANVSHLGGADKPVTVSGSWNADLAAMAGQPVIANLPGKMARTAAGEFTATVQNGTELDTKVTLTGHDATHTLTANLHADSGTDGIVQFQLPLTVAFGKNVSVFSTEGTWSTDESGHRIGARLTGDDVDLAHIELLAAPLVAALHSSRSAGANGESGGSIVPASMRAGDRKPFWQGWSGELNATFTRLRSRAKVYREVGGTLDVDPDALRLKRGWIAVSKGEPTQAEGTLLFDAAADFPYAFKGGATATELDVVPLLGALPKGQDPWLEGHFSVTATVSGNGRNLDDLERRTQEQYEITAKSGIIRLLKTSVSDTLPEEAPEGAMANAAGTVGSWVGWLAGVKKDSLGSNEKKVSKNTDAVLNLTSQLGEIGFDQLTVTATRGHDQTIHLVAVELLARDERMTGSGSIGRSGGETFTTRPLGLDLKLGFRGSVAGLLTQAALLTKKNDELGYLEFVRPVHFGGTLQTPDVTDWHDLLAKAAQPPAGKPAKK